MEGVSALQTVARGAVILTDGDQVNDASRLAAVRPGERQEVPARERRVRYDLTNTDLGHGHCALFGVGSDLETLLVARVFHSGLGYPRLYRCRKPIVLSLCIYEAADRGALPMPTWLEVQEDPPVT